MDKRITFLSSDEGLGQTFAEAIDITPRGGGLEKIAGKLHPEISAYLRTLRPDPAYQYVLMTPMGAYEYWGMNVNGDVFPEISLAFDMGRDDPMRVAEALERKWLAPFGKKIPPGTYREFGHKTFLEANRYRHHQNKDPSKSYGGIVLSVWNPSMRRVEVIVRHDRERAKQVGAEEIIRDLDEGKPRQISMGCRVPFDVCTTCGHISRTPRDYCRHLQLNMGSINPDGSINGAVNFFPRFFDLSDVFVPAAKESGVLMKVASARESAHLRGSSAKLAATSKWAEIRKEILPNSGQPTVGMMSNCEPDIPKSRLLQGNLADLLTTLAGLGIILKPHEFQQASLHRMGMGRYSDELDRRGLVFRPRRSETHVDLPPDRFRPRLASLLADLLEDRSGLVPYLPRRVMRVTIIRASPPPARRWADSEPLLKVAHAYDAYRTSLKELPQLLDVAVSEHPGYYAKHFFSELLTDSMEKMASSAFGASLPDCTVPLYVYSAYRNSAPEAPPSWEMPLPRHSPARALIAPTL